MDKKDRRLVKRTVELQARARHFAENSITLMRRGQWVFALAELEKSRNCLTGVLRARNLSDHEHTSEAALAKARESRPRPARKGMAMMIVCAPCWAHYGDRQPCDEGKPANSPHRRGIPLPMPGRYIVCPEGAVCSACGCWPHAEDCAGRPQEAF